MSATTSTWWHLGGSSRSVAKPYATPISEAWRDSDRLLLMLRQLIVSRFKMKYHTENRLVGAFVLTADNPKLAKAIPSSRTRCVDDPTTGRSLPVMVIDSMSEDMDGN